MKHNAPQHAFGFDAEAFNLSGEVLRAPILTNRNSEPQREELLSRPVLTWREQLEVNIRAKVRELRAVGTTGMSARNLFQVVKLPHHTEPQAPRTPEGAREIFNQTARKVCPAFLI